MLGSVTRVTSSAGDSTGTINLVGYFNFSVQGTFTGVVNMERYISGNWDVTDTFSAAESGFGYEASVGGTPYRLRAATLTAGTVTMTLGQ